VELDDWNCCGASSGHNTDYELSLALPARNLAIAEKAKLNMAVACAACFLRFKQTNHDLKGNEDLRKKIEKLIGMPYAGNVEVKHLVDVFANEVGLEEIKKRVKKPLKGLKLAAYYGCYLVRPPDITQFDDPENPQILDNLLKAIGAEPVEYTHKVECCGGSLLLARTDIVVKLVGISAEPQPMPVRPELSPLVRSVWQTLILVRMALMCPLCISANCSVWRSARRKKNTTTWFKKHIHSPVGILKAQGLI